MFNKPSITLRQNFTTATPFANVYLPSLIVGPRYNVHEQELLGDYTANSYSYTYPNQEASSEVDLDYVKVYMSEIYLKYYTSAHTWRKVGGYSNYLRTILTDNLVFKTNGGYPHSSLFRDRGVEVGDQVDISLGTYNLRTKVTGFVADQSTASIGAATVNSGNQASQSHNISAVTPGAGQSGVTCTASGTYVGSLQDDVLEDTYTATVISSGVAPVVSITAPSIPSHTSAAYARYSGQEPDTYYIRIVLGGEATVATYQIISNSGDNTDVITTPALDTYINCGTKGLLFKWVVRTAAFTAGEEWKVEVTPSEARIRVTTTSGTDDVSSVVFPGFIATGVTNTVAIGTRGLLFSFDGSTMPLGYTWSATCQKAVAAVTAVSQGTFTGGRDVNFFVKVLQGGTWGNCVVEITGTSRKYATVAGAGAGNAVTLEDGAEVYFNTNSQGGLIKGDIFTVASSAAKDTAYRTLVLEDSISDAADVCTISSTLYGGSNPPLTANTMVASGTYSALNSGLEKYNQERYMFSVTTRGDYGVAEITVTTLSGNDVGTLTPVLGANNYGSYGLVVTFSGANLFEVGDIWIFTVSKPNLTVNLCLPTDSQEIPQPRVEDQSQSAWTATTTEVTLNANIRLTDTDWDQYISLPINNATSKLTYRCIHTVGANTIYTITNASAIPNYLGTVHVDNPVAFGANLAISYGAAIYAIYPSSISAYSTLINKLELASNIYRIALMSHDADTIALFVAHINKMNTTNKWRNLFICREVEDSSILATGNATIAINPNDGNKYNLVTSTDTNLSVGAVGDKFEYLGTEYTIKQKISTTQLVITEDFGAPQTVESPFNIIHYLSSQDKADMLVYYGNYYKNRKICNMVPSTFNTSIPGYYICALIAGLKASLPVHQPISCYELPAITTIENDFSEEQLDQIANAGNFIITQDSITSPCYVRHQLTTDTTDIKHRELSYTENLDEISYGVYNIVYPFKGKYNIHTGVLEQINANLEAYFYGKTGIVTVTSGPQLISHSNLLVEASSEDTVHISVSLVLPYPFNYGEIDLYV